MSDFSLPGVNDKNLGESFDYGESFGDVSKNDFIQLFDLQMHFLGIWTIQTLKVFPHSAICRFERKLKKQSGER